MVLIVTAVVLAYPRACFISSPQSNFPSGVAYRLPSLLPAPAIGLFHFSIARRLQDFLPLPTRAELRLAAPRATSG